jgi:hypothetical protein
MARLSDRQLCGDEFGFMSVADGSARDGHEVELTVGKPTFQVERPESRRPILYRPPIGNRWPRGLKRIRPPAAGRGLGFLPRTRGAPRTELQLGFGSEFDIDSTRRRRVAA